MGNTTYRYGLDVLGASPGPETNQGILIRVNNALELARSQGKIATVASVLAPATIEGAVYKEMAKKLKESLAKEHVDADVTIVEPTAFKTADGKHIAQDVMLGLGAGGVAVVLAAFLWKLVHRKKK